MNIFWKRLSVTIGYLIAIAILMAALLVSVTRLFSPIVVKHRADFEGWASQLLDHPVTMGSVDIFWRTYAPELVFEHVVILDPKTHAPLFNIPKLSITMDIWRSIEYRQLMLKTLKITGVQADIQEVKAGQYQIAGLKDYLVSSQLPTPTNQEKNPVLSLLLSQPFLVLDDVQINYINLQKVKHTFFFDKLVLANKSEKHRITAKISIEEEVPTTIDLQLKWYDTQNSVQPISADLYIYAQGILLPEWLKDQTGKNFQIRQGIGSAKIWAEWNKAAWQKVQTTLQVYDLNIYSLNKKKSLQLSRLSGNFGWKRDGEVQTIAGDNILLDFADNLWPTTNFTVQYHSLPDDSLQIRSLHIGYLDLAKTNAILQMSGLLPASFETTLMALQPQGEIHELQSTTKGSLTDLSQLTVDGFFSHFAMQSFQQWPAVSNVSGQLLWDGRQGELKIASQNASVYFNKIFTAPLEFTQLNLHLSWLQDEKGIWQIRSNRVALQNADMDLQAILNVSIKPDAAPFIDLSANFKMANAANMTQYLPLKIFDPDLIKWLKEAFLKGQIEKGQAILRGNLTDFPFDQNTGTFKISGQVKDLDFHYAPDWPILQKIQGQLTFSGRSMQVDIHSGTLLDIPLTNIHGEIPYLGDALPQVVNVMGAINGNLAQAMHFIRMSPLSKMLGNRFAALQLKGPMQLKLNLSVPLKTPAATKVMGNTQITDGSLNLSEWDLLINQLNGNLQFTESGVQANNLSGHLFNELISLSLATQTKTKSTDSQIVASLTGKINIPTLANWLSLPLTTWAEGSTTYQAQLFVASQNGQPLLMVIQSDLQGIALKLPGMFAKNANTQIPFQLQLKISPELNKPLQNIITYGKLLSVASAVEKVNHHTRLIGGEIRLGGGPVAWQSTPGFLITGQLDKVDWDMLQPYIGNFLDHKKSNQSKSTSNYFDLLRGVDVKVNLLSLLGLQLKNIRVQLAKSATALTIGLENNDVSGDIIWPLSGTKVIQAKFNRIYVSDQGKTMSSINPATLPPISFIGNEVRYGGKSLGRVELDMKPMEGGQSINRLTLDSLVLKLRAQGHWQAKKSRLQGNLTAPDVSKLFNAWGIGAKNLVGSKGSLDFDLTWPGMPFNPTFQGMYGTASLQLTEGRIVDLGDSTDAKIGLGRLLNLLSLQSIPRRLSFNFSDLFQKGYSFDFMKGDFILRNGSAFTENARFDGPIARVDIAGRIGFAAKDVDMKLSVTPYVTGSLPIVATIAVNPLAGAATWVVDKLVSRQVSKIATYQYVITGPWDNPNWQEAK